MRTRLVYLGQALSTEGIFISYDQFLAYTEVVVEQDPETLVRLPYEYGPTNANYSDTLQSSVPGFETIGTPISLPDIAPKPTDPPTATPTSSTSSPTPVPVEPRSGLTTGAIIGIAIGGTIFLSMIFWILYSWCRRCREDKEGYVSAGSTPPTQLIAGTGEEVSVMDDPTKVGGDLGSVAEYGDQRLV